jgi:hypothetical protein
MAVGTEAKEMSLECRLGNSEGVGGGEETPLKPKSSRRDDEEEDEDEEEGEVTPLSTLHPLKTSLLLATSSVSKHGFLLARVGRNGPG